MCDNLTSLNDGKKEISSYLKNIRGTNFNIADWAYNTILNKDEEIQPYLLRHLCEVYKITRSTQQIEAVASKYHDSYRDLSNKYGKAIDLIISGMIRTNKSEDLFYKSLWEVISKSPLFDTPGARIYALCASLTNPRIPYFHIDTNIFYHVSRDKFRDLLESNKIEAQRMLFINNSNIYAQQTEKASVLLNEFGIQPPINGYQNEETIKEYETNIIRMAALLKSNGDNQKAGN